MQKVQKLQKLKKLQKRNNPLKQVILLNKKEGETPLEALSLFRSKHKEYKDVSMTYAGRLDPMASGLLLILAGEEIKSKDKYLLLSKEYEFEVLFGFATDTYDILGKITNNRKKDFSPIIQRDLEKKIKENLKHFTGTFIQKYPIYSSKTLSGKALFEYGRSGEIVKVPEREVFVKSLKFLGLKKISSKFLLNNVEKRIGKVQGDFRQAETLKIWQNNLILNQESFFVGSFKIKCGSGTYVRGIANSLGGKVNIPALAYSIKRTKIGKYDNV